MAEEIRNTPITLTAEQLQGLLLQLVKAMKEPSEEEKAKLAHEKAEKERKLRESIELAKAEEDARQLRWNTCAHMKPDGRTAIAVGQVYSDGMRHPFCQICHKQFPPVKPKAEDLI